MAADGDEPDHLGPPPDAGNYGFDELMEHDRRYDRTDEFVDICRRLWASVEQEAVVMDHDSGLFCDPERMHYLNTTVRRGRCGGR